MAVPLPPADLLASTVLTVIATGGGDFPLSKGIISPTGMPATIPYKGVTAYKKTSYTAGTNQVATVALALATPVVGVAQSVTIVFTNDNTTIPIEVLPATTSQTDLAVLFRAAINLATTRIVATGATTNIIATEQSLTGAFILYFSDTGVTVAATTPHVSASGTVAEVQQYTPNTITSVTGFCKYQIACEITVPESQGQGKVKRAGQFIVWADESATNFSTFSSQVDGTFDTTIILTTNATTVAAGIAKYLAR